MKPVLINGDVWVINRVSPGNPLLIDRTGSYRAATADPLTRSINISIEVTPPLLDSVLLHEVAHAITISYGLLDVLRSKIPYYLWVTVEEWAIAFLEKYSIEAIILASESLNRPLCINGKCI